MQRAGNQLFAGSAFAHDQNGRWQGGDLSDLLEDTLHARGTSDDISQMVAPTDLGAQRIDLPLEFRCMRGIAQQNAQLLDLEWLLDIVVGAQLDGFDGRLYRPGRGDHDHRNFGVGCMQPFEGLQPVNAGHHHIQQDGVGALQFCRLEPFLSGSSNGDVKIVLEEEPQGLADPFLVVDDEDATTRPGFFL